MSEQTNNTDMSDEPDRQDLEDRVEQLESTISQMLPSRRDALKLGGAALVGGAAMSGSASAGTSQAGTIGTSGAPVDVNAEDIDAVSVDTEKLNTPPTGVVVGLSADQSVADGTITTVNFDTTISEFGNVSGLLDAPNNQVIVPSGYEYALVKSQLRFQTTSSVNLYNHVIGGQSPDGAGGNATGSPSENLAIAYAESAWEEVTAGTGIRQRFRHDDGGTVTIEGTRDTYLEVRLL